MATKVMLFYAADDSYEKLKPFYDKEVEKGNLEIVAHAIFENGAIKEVKPTQKDAGGKVDFQYVIISAYDNFYDRLKFLEAQGMPRKNIIDGKLFMVENFDFPRFLKENVAYGTFAKRTSFSAAVCAPLNNQVYTIGKTITVKLGVCSLIGANARIDITRAAAELNIGNYCDVSSNVVFEIGLNSGHNYHNMSSFYKFGWKTPQEYYMVSPKLPCKINIGNDVTIETGARLKSNNPEKPLTIGDGAVITSDSVVIKDVPAYAIVQGNPAEVVGYRFPEKTIASLQKIKWWTWDITKIHDNFQLFSDVEKFVATHDK